MKNNNNKNISDFKNANIKIDAVLSIYPRLLLKCYGKVQYLWRFIPTSLFFACRLQPSGGKQLDWNSDTF